LRGYIEYAYYLMATAAGIDMSECRLHHEGGRNHFMTRRFDRDERGRKVHMQSLGAMQHFDFNDPASYSYEQANMTIRDLGLGMDVVAQQYKRAVFNVVARNQDDHVKNISFLMDRSGAWRLSPAYDVAYSYNPSGSWTRDHQMSIGGKRNDFAHDDLMRFASNVGLKSSKVNQAIENIVGAVARWQEFAEQAGVEHSDASRIEKTFRMNLLLK
jgi:serine/threonine-protein kinase HipA